MTSGPSTTGSDDAPTSATGVEPRPASCCSPAKRSTCCEASEKSACCGDPGTATGTCGCQ